MQPTQIMAKKSMKLRFIILQLLTLLLVAIVLVSFSDISIAPLSSNDKLVTNIDTKEDKTADNKEAIAALENNLVSYQKLVKEKQDRINELEGNIKSLQANNSKEATPSVNETTLKADLQRMELELSEKEATINELVGRIKILENAKPVSTASPDKALVEKLRGEIQKLETRNALLVKLNSDLKKNNEYLSSQQKQ